MFVGVEPLLRLLQKWKWEETKYYGILGYSLDGESVKNLNGNGDPDLPSGRDNYRCGGEWYTDPALDQKIEPCNLSTTTPLVINWDMEPIDLAKKANPCLHNEEHKREQERKQPNCKWMINLTMLGSHKPLNGETVLDRLI